MTLEIALFPEVKSVLMLKALKITWKYSCTNSFGTLVNPKQVQVQFVAIL